MKYRELDKYDKNLFAKDFLKTFLCEVGRWLLAFGSAGLIFVLLILAFRWKYGFIIIVSFLLLPIKFFLAQKILKNNASALLRFVCAT